MKNTADESRQEPSQQAHASDEEQDEMLPEYDFSDGIRGKHGDAFRYGYMTVVHHPDGRTTETFHFSLPQGVILLDSDLWAYFPDSATVNDFLHLFVKQLDLLGEHKPSLPQPQREERTG